MVRRLVEEEQVGVLEEEARERDATLLAAGDGADVRIVGWAAERLHGDVDVALHVPRGGVDPVLERRLLGTDRVVVGVGIRPRPSRRCTGRAAPGPRRRRP